MSPIESSNRIRTLFDAASSMTRDERKAYLLSECADNGEEQQVVERLLHAFDEGGEFLSQPSVAHRHANPHERADTTKTAPLIEGPGSRVGPYKLLQMIGEGGFGTVFLAEQDKPLRRRVALKIIKLGMDTKQIIARFEAERQALALMDHPNIAKVLDAGATDSGRPYFVMEYVVGDTITHFADVHKLPLPHRLELFTQVCHAVQHAHTKGIIHRDLKPGNILVSMTDGKPLAKVIDFGIAKATASPLTEKTLFTEHRQLIGTPEYMSPEQAEGSPDIDTRADVYAMGVLLYEMLTGVTPFDARRLRSAAFAEMQRIIKEEEPPTPSMRVTSFRLHEARGAGQSPAPHSGSSLAEARGLLDDVFLVRQIKGELDWIAMKALDKDRARRYESPNQLAQDIQRHLSGEAVLAAPPSSGYRVRKFVRRNRGTVLAVTAVAVVLGVVGTTWGFLKAEQRAEGERVAKVEAQESQALAEAKTAEAIEASTVADLARAAETTAKVEYEYQSYLANLAAADLAIKASKPYSAIARLDACPAAMRGWEWRYLHAALDNSIFKISDDEQEYESASFSPDGSRAIITIGQYQESSGCMLNAGFEDWDIQSGSCTWRTSFDTSDLAQPLPSLFGAWIGGHAEVRVAPLSETTRVTTFSGNQYVGGVGVVELDPVHERAIVCPIMGGTANMYDLTRPGNGTPVGGKDDVYWVRFSPDGDRLVMVDGNGKITVWDVEQLTSIVSMDNIGMKFANAEWSGDGTRIIACTDHGAAILFDARTGAELAQFDIDEERVPHACLNSDGTRAAVWSYSWESGIRAAVAVFDTATGVELSACSMSSIPSECAFIPGSDRVAVLCDGLGVWDYVTHAWSWQQWKQCRSLNVSADGTTIVTISGDAVLTVDARSGETRKYQILDTPAAACVERAGRILVSYVAGTMVSAGDLYGPQAWIDCEGQFSLMTSPQIGGYTFYVDRQGTRGRLVDWNGTRVMKEWSIDAQSPGGVVTSESASEDLRKNGRITVVASGDSVPCAAFSSDGRTFACLYSGRRVIDVLDLPSGDVRHKLDMTSNATSVAMSDGGTRIATSHEDGVIRVWSVASGSCDRFVPLPLGSVDRLVVSDDGEQVVVLLKDGSLWALPGASRTCTLELTGQERLGDQSSLTLSPDGSKILAATRNCGGPNNQLRVWSLTASGHVRRVDTDPGRTGVVDFAAFSPDGRWLIYQLPDLSIKVYDVERSRVVVTYTGYSRADADNRTKISPDSSRLVLATETRGSVIRLADLKELTRFSWENNPVAQVEWSQDSSFISATTPLRDSVTIYHAADMTKATECGPCRPLIWTTKGPMLACDDGTSVTLLDVSGIHVYPRVIDNDATKELGRDWFQFLPDGDRFVTCGAAWRISDGKRLSAFEPLSPNARPMVLSVSPDGRLLYRAWSFDPDPYSVRPFTVDIIDVETGNLVSRYSTSNRIDVWSGDGTRAVSVRDNAIIVSDIMSGRELLTLDTGLAGYVPVMVWPPSGQMLLAFDHEHFLRTYDAISESERVYRQRGELTRGPPPK